jgi:capsular exopolysaccharide synthesis family protein
VSVNEASRVLRERWRVIIVCLLLGLLGAGVATYLMPRQYSSNVTLYVSIQGQAESSDAAYQASQLAKERVVSYAPLLTDERLTEPVIRQLQLDLTPAQLADRIAVSVEPETVVLSAAVTDTSPERAAAIANALAQEFVGLVQELEQPFGPTTPIPGRAAPVATKIGAQIIRPATPALTPVAPNVPFNMALGGALGLVVGVAAAFLRNARDTSVRSVNRLHELSNAPVLTQVAYDRDVPIRPLTSDEQLGSPRAEAFRKLRTNLQFLDRSDEHRVIVVTSALVGEGKSTTACNLALALSEAGHRVLLIDANLRRPQVDDYLGLEPGPGLSNVLTGRVSWRYACQRWNRGGFDVLPAGPVPLNPSELVASRRLAELLAEVRPRYSFVIVDAPALLPVSDAAALAARADGTVLVVRYRKITEEQLAAAVAALDAVAARLLGTVLTMTPRRRARRDGTSPYPEPMSGDRAVLSAPIDEPTTALPAANGSSVPPAAREPAPASDGTVEVNHQRTDEGRRRPSPAPRR